MAFITPAAVEQPSGSRLPVSSLAGQTLRPDNTDPTVFRVRGPYELWLEDFAPGGNITYATGDPVTAGDSCTSYLNAAVAKAILLNPNRGGVTIRFDRQRYWFATQPSNITATLSLIGEGTPGQFYPGAKGCTQLITANGIVGLPFVSASHLTVGPILRYFAIYANSGSTTGTGIQINNFDAFEVSHVSASNYSGGAGLDITGGGSGDAQYGLIHDFRGGGSAIEIRLHGAAPNGIAIVAPVLEGNPGSSQPVANSVGISIESGDTCRIIAPRIQGYAIGIDHQATAQSAEVYGMRGEYNNRHVRLGASSRSFGMYGGSFDDNLLNAGSVSIGVDIVAGAQDYFLNPGDFQLSKAGFVEINGHIQGKGTVVYRNLLDWQAGATGTGAYTVTNPTTDRALNVTADTLPQVAAVLGTLIADLQARGLVG